MTRHLLVFASILLLATAVPAQEVRLPLADYEKLYLQANPEPEAEPEPPVPLAFERAEVEVEVGQSSARVVQQWTLVLYGDDWRTLKVPEGMTITRVDFGGMDGLLKTLDDGGWPELRLRGAGRHRVTVESAVPVQEDLEATRGTWALELQLPEAAVVDGVLRVARTGSGAQSLGVTEVVVEGPAGASVDGIVVPLAGQDAWSFTGGPGTTLALSLLGAPVTPLRDGLPLRFEVLSTHSMRVLRTRTELTAWIEAKVSQGKLEQLRIPLSSLLERGFELVDVKNTRIADYRLVDEVLEVEATQPATAGDSFRVTLRFTGGPMETVSPVRLAVDGAARVLALSKVDLEGDGLLELVDAGAARLPDERELQQLSTAFEQAKGEALVLPDVVAGVNMPRWTPVWAERTRVLAVQVEVLRLDVLIGDAGQAFYRLGLQVASSGGERLTIRLPAGSRVLDARRDGAVVTPGLASSAGSEVAVVLPLRGGEQAQQLWLEATAPLGTVPDEGRLTIPMPQFSAPVNRVEALLQLPAGRSYQLTESGRRIQGLQAYPQPGPHAAAPPLATWLTRGTLTGSVAEGMWLPVPEADGAAQLRAGWDALASQLAPLVIEVEERDVEREWF